MSAKIIRSRNKKRDRRPRVIIQKKLVVLFMSILAFFIILAGRLFYISNNKYEEYKKRVLEQQYYDSTIIPYKRGTIYDSNMIVLANSEKVFNLIIDTSLINEDEESKQVTLQVLDKYFEYDEQELTDYMTSNPNSKYYRLLKSLEYENVDGFIKEKEENDNIVGVWFEEEFKRNYPNDNTACDVLGFSSGDNVGMYGLEQYYNDKLNGTNGRIYGYINDDENHRRTTKPAIDGNSMVTSIDINIQNIVEKHILEFNKKHEGEEREGELGSKNTAVIVMNPHTGEILAMASYPNFDLNDPYNLINLFTQEDIDLMSDDEKTEHLNNLWKNFCISETYEPGSPAKLFTAATGLEYGKVSGNEYYTCNGSYTVPGHPKPIHCANVNGHGELSFAQVIEKSCNVGMMQMGFTIGLDDFMKGQETYGVGLKTNIDLQGEMRTENTVFDKEKMVPTDLAVSSFGQGYNVTMIQMATIFSSLINGGHYYEPHVVKQIINENGSVLENIKPRIMKDTISKSTSEKVIEYCDGVVANGTGAKARPAGYAIGGKTGTAEKLPRGENNYVLSFMGYAPAKEPEVLVYVVVDEPNVAIQADSSYAMEICRNIMAEMLPYMNIFQTEELTEDEIEAETEIEIETEIETEIGGEVVDETEDSSEVPVDITEE